MKHLSAYSIDFVSFARITGAWLLFLLLGSNVQAQSEQFDYSQLKFMPLDSYYRANQIDVVAADNCDLYFEVYTWLGTRYCYGGRTRNGIDCSDFASVIYEKIYNRNIGGTAGDIFNKCTPVDTSELREGDLLFFKISRKGISHMAVYLQNRRFAHATVHGGVMVNSLDERYYARSFYKAGRLKD
ncbi:MAG: C40 family peptidase [Chitinophagales bacterium]